MCKSSISPVFFLRGTDGVFHYYHKPPSVLGTAKHIFIVEACGMNFKQLIIDSVITVNGQTLHVSSKSLRKVHLTAVHPCCIFQVCFSTKSKCFIYKTFWFSCLLARRVVVD